MKKGLSVFVFLAGGVLSLFATSRAMCGPALRIMTWNIGHADLAASPARDEDTAHIARVITEISPDLAALQEQASGEQFLMLLELLGGGYRGITTAGSSGRGVSVISRLCVLEEKYIRVPSGWTAPALRVRTASGAEVLFAGCHLPAGRHSRRRRAHVEHLIESVLENNTNAVLAGDLNLTPERGPVFSFRGMLGFFLTDCAGTDAESYRMLASAAEDCGPEAGPTAILGRRIDYLFASTEDFRRARAEVVRGKRTGRMDHDPLVADFVVRE